MAQYRKASVSDINKVDDSDGRDDDRNRNTLEPDTFNEGKRATESDTYG